MKNFLPLIALAATLGFSGPLAAAADRYQPLKEIAVGGEGGWDYLTLDAAARRLYVTHASRIVVIDLEHNAVIGTIEGLAGAHGFALDPQRHSGFATSGKGNHVATVDLATLQIVRKSPTGENPDAVLYEPGRDEVYAFNGRSHSVSILAAGSGTAVATLPLPGKPEFSQSDGRRVFVNLEDKNAVATLDARTHATGPLWSVAPGEEPTGLELDRAHHRLFVGCGNRELVVLDSQDGHRVATVPAGAGIDAVGFDPGTQLIFTSNGEDGTVTIVHEDTPDKYSLVQTLTTEPGARTLAVDPVSHRLYLTSAKFAPAASPGVRPTLVAGSVKVLVYGPSSHESTPH